MPEGRNRTCRAPRP